MCTPHDFALTQGGVSVTREDFLRAPLVIFRRWCFEPEPAVRSTLAEADHRAFAEREWEALLWSVLLDVESDAGAVPWANRPSALLLGRSKLWLMQLAAKAGFTVPSFVISNHLSVPERDTGRGFVCKAISDTEQIGPSQRFPTTAVPQAHLDEHLGERSGCPSLVQTRVDAECEVRVFAWFDDLFCVAQRTAADYVDIRYLRHDQVDYERTELPAALLPAVSTLMRSARFSCCALDFLVDDGRHLLIDVTPSGLWSPFEENGWITDAILNRIVRRAEYAADAA